MRTRQGRPVRSKGLALAAATTCSACWWPPRDGARSRSIRAAAGLDVARSAAGSWAPDAVLIYVENDEAVAADGTSRAGLSLPLETLDQVPRVFDREGKIVVAETLDMKFEAPPLATDWIDSGAASRSGDRIAATEFQETGGASLSTMLLMRGAFQDKDPIRPPGR
jgi:hypothetical protein